MIDPHFPDWRALVRYSAPGPQPTVLLDQPDLRVFVAGLEPGGRIPPHPGPQAVFHVLDGDGRIQAGDERFDVTAGATVIVPAGAVRGIEATTRLAFLAVRIGAEPG